MSSSRESKSRSVSRGFDIVKAAAAPASGSEMPSHEQGDLFLRLIDLRILPTTCELLSWSLFALQDRRKNHHRNEIKHVALELQNASGNFYLRKQVLESFKMLFAGLQRLN